MTGAGPVRSVCQLLLWHSSKQQLEQAFTLHLFNCKCRWLPLMTLRMREAC